MAGDVIRDSGLVVLILAMAPVNENACQQNQAYNVSTEPIKELNAAFPKVAESTRGKEDSKDTVVDKTSKETRGTKRQISEVVKEVSQSQPTKSARMGSLLLMPLTVLTAPVKLVQSGFRRVFVRRASPPAPDNCRNILGCASGSACKSDSKVELFEDVNDAGQFYCAKCWGEDAEDAEDASHA